MVEFMEFRDGECYWLKTKKEGWQIGKCMLFYHYNKEPEFIFEQFGIDFDVWHVGDFTEAIHIPRPT